MAAYTTVAIASIWAQALASSAPLKAWAQAAFARDWAVSVGTDMRHSPSANDAPFCVFFPDAVADPDRSANQHTIGLILGIADEEFVTVNGVTTMQALKSIDGLWPSVRAVLDGAIPGAMVTGYEIDYLIHSFPLVMLSVTATVEQKKPIGSRY